MFQDIEARLRPCPTSSVRDVRTDLGSLWIAGVLVALRMVCVAFLLDVGPVAGRVTLASSVTARSSEKGLHPWYEIHVDSDNPRNMIICGTKWDSQANAPYGFVYHSSDGGANWGQVLEDKSSAWVTEQSCSYGVGGIAYFVSDASKVIDGAPHHDLGTTRIYVSRDFGQTWRVGVTTGWTDASASVVDTLPGPNQNRLYVFFGSLGHFYKSVGQIDLADAEDAEIKRGDAGSRVGMISYKDGDVNVSGPFSNAEMKAEKNRGAYPGPALLLGSGSILAFYGTKHKLDDGSDRITIESVRANANRSALEEPVTIVNSAVTDQCGYFLTTAGGYDPVRDKLYFVYQDIRRGTCHLFVATSTDGGRSWSSGQQIVSPDETRDTVYMQPAIAVNEEGILGVMWEQKGNSGCWMFAVSEDGGASLSRAQRLGACQSQAMKVSPLSLADLWTAISQAGGIGGAQDEAKIELRNIRNEVWRNESAIAVTQDGTFHPVWVDAGDGDGEIHTAAIHATSAASLIATETKGLADITSRVAVLYGGDQHYDAGSGMLTVDIVIRNKSSEPIRGPLRFAVLHFFENYGLSEIINATNKIAGAGAVWDISSIVPAGTLAPGATSAPFPLKFHYLPVALKQSRVDTEDLLNLKVGVYADGQSAGKN